MIAKNKRVLKNGFQYDSLIPKADLKTLKLSNFINVDDTVGSMKKIVLSHHHQVAKIAQLLKRNTINETCKTIFDFVYQHIQYTKDRAGFEEIRTPARTWADRQSGVDCDCYSVFIGSLLYTLGIPFAFRVTKYSGDWQHVYPIVYDQTSSKGYHIIDCVVDEYDYEVPYTDKKDYKMSTLMLSGIDTDDYLDYETTTVSEDLAGLGRAKRKKKKKKKEKKKKGLFKRNPKKAAARKQTKAVKRQAKKAAKTKKTKTRGKVKANTSARKQKRQTKRAARKANPRKKRGIFSKVKARVQKGKEKRKIKRAAKKEKRKANPKKRGLFSKIRARKKAKREAKKNIRIKQNPTLNPIKVNPALVRPSKPVIVTPNVVTPIKNDVDEFAQTATTNPNPNDLKEFMSDDGETYVNTGSWGGGVTTNNTSNTSNDLDNEINFDAEALKNQMNQDADNAIQNSNQDLEQDIQNLTQNITSKALAIREPNEIEPFDEDVEELDVNALDEEDEIGGELKETTFQDKVSSVFGGVIAFAKEKPAITGAVVVGVPVGIWGLSKLLGGSKSVNGVDGLEGMEGVDGVDGLDGLDGKKKKGKKKSKTKTTKSKSTKPKTTSKARIKHGRASFNGLN